MSKSKKTLAATEAVLTRAEAAAKLRILADKIEKNELSLEGPESVSADIPKTVQFELEYKEKIKKSGIKKFEIDIEIEWAAEGQAKLV